MNDCVGGAVPGIAEVHEATDSGVAAAVDVEELLDEELLDEELLELEEVLEVEVEVVLDEDGVVVVVLEGDEVSTK